MQQFGIEPEAKEYQPHITLGRVANKTLHNFSSVMEPDKAIEFGTIPIETVILYRSDLRRTGAIYTPLSETKLGS